MSEPSPQRVGPEDASLRSLRRWHQLWGWGALTFFLSMGLVLEALHGLKWGAYVGVDAETRRTMWRLCHAHGSLLGLVHLAFAATISSGELKRLRWPSRALCLASLALPGGFFFGGLWFHAGDPGLGVLLVPIGGLAAIYAAGTNWLERLRQPT